MSSNSIAQGKAVDRAKLVPGAYWVDGYSLSNPKERGLVEVRQPRGPTAATMESTLVCNIHLCNTGGLARSSDWSRIATLADRIKFYGPLIRATGA